jgi:hypothetical protein
MRPLRLLAAVPLFALSLLCAAEDPIAAFQKAMAGEDQAAKKAAIGALANASVGSDDKVLPLLAAAVGDRQARDAAIAALRTRTGLQPSAVRGAGGYPAYPADDTASAWGAWVSARAAARATEAKLKALEDAKTRKPEAPAAGATKAAGEGDERAPAPAPPAAEAVADPDFGGLDRVTFRTGGSLLCYVLGKRLDEEGNLISVRVMHTDQGGEETLAAELIARIEEEIR